MDSSFFIVVIYKNMNYSVGYIKDLLAFLAFIIVFIITYNTADIQKFRIIILWALLLCISIDGVFTCNPEYHNTILGNNNATYSIIAVIFAYIPILYMYFNTLFK